MQKVDTLHPVPFRIIKTFYGWWFGTWLLFFHILGIVTPTNIFQRGRSTTNQKSIDYLLFRACLDASDQLFTHLLAFECNVFLVLTLYCLDVINLRSSHSACKASPPFQPRSCGLWFLLVSSTSFTQNVRKKTTCFTVKRWFPVKCFPSISPLHLQYWLILMWAKQ